MDAAPLFRQALRALVRDARSLTARISRPSMNKTGSQTGSRSWSPERLRALVKEHLGDERIVVLANREPYSHEVGPDGTTVRRPASGLVTALEPVLRACSGVWVAHGSGTADRQAVDARDRLLVPPGEDSYVLRRVWLSEEEEQGYYYGYANEGLWPLCHAAHTRPHFRAEEFEMYARVNQRFADAVAEEVDSEDAIVLVQDYHFALAPLMIREHLPNATIISFWHIPWPDAERIAICPERERLIRGMLGSSAIGFHTDRHGAHFIQCAEAFVESRVDVEARAVVKDGRATKIRTYPASVAWPPAAEATALPVSEARSVVRAEAGLAPDALVGLGVDRLDYTKGIEERLNTVDTLLARYPVFRGRFTFIQLAAPSRLEIPRYRQLAEDLRKLTREINERWSEGSYQPVVFLEAHHDEGTVFRYFRAADFCYVSSLHDGMNLVAKEFVASRNDEEGVLILSRFTGAASELTQALIVNPYDLREASDAMATALSMPTAEKVERMRALRRVVAELNVYRWAGRMLLDAVDLRREQRLPQH